MGSLPRFNSKFIVIAVSVILLLYFVVFPMGILLYDSIMVNGAINFGNYADVYSQDVNWRALSNTVQLSLLVMVASVIITFPLAWLVGRTDMPGKKTYRTLLVASYMIPPYVGAIAWVQLLNPSVGYLNSIFKWILQLQQSPFDIYTMGGLAWVLTLFYSPFAFITISRAMEKMDPTLEEAARIFLEVYEEACADPEAMHHKPENTVIGRPDEVQAARKPVLRWYAEGTGDAV